MQDEYGGYPEGRHVELRGDDEARLARLPEPEARLSNHTHGDLPGVAEVEAASPEEDRGCQSGLDSIALVREGAALFLPRYPKIAASREDDREELVHGDEDAA